MFRLVESQYFGNDRYNNRYLPLRGKGLTHRFKSPRGLITIILLLVVGAASLVAAFPAVKNMLTPPSERYRNEGDAFLALGQLPESVLSYRQAVEADPKNVRALQSLADVYTRQGRLRMAMRYGAMAGSVDPASRLVLPPADGPLNPLWINPEVEAVPTGGVLQNGVLVAAYEDGSLLAIQASDGRTLWKTRLPARLTSAPVVNGQQVLAGDIKGTLHALSIIDGSPTWTFDTGGPIYAAPLAAGVTVYCPSSSGKMYALQASDGKQRWEYSTSSPLNGTPALDGSRLYFGSSSGKLYALDAATGTAIWPDGIQTDGAVESQPVIDQNRVVFGSGDGRVYALAADSGGQYWRYPTLDGVFAQPVIMDGVVYIASSSGTFSALDFVSGKRIWQVDLSARLRNTPAIDASHIYQTGEASDRLYILDRQNGTLLSAVSTGDWTAAGPWLDGNRLLILGKDGATLSFQIKP
jgi:outer membrane protein assembly factor BamB